MYYGLYDRGAQSYSLDLPTKNISVHQRAISILEVQKSCGIVEMTTYQDEVPVAALEAIDLRPLLSMDATEQQRLRRACALTGFVYLDLRGDGTFESDWEELLDFGQEYFALPASDKIKDARSSDFYG